MKIEECTLLFRESLSSIGLENFKLDMHYYPNQAGYGVVLTRSLDYIECLNVPNFIDLVLKPIANDIANSPVVKAELSDLKTKLEAANTELEELRPYKTYYNLQYKLNNG